MQELGDDQLNWRLMYNIYHPQSPENGSQRN